MNLKNEGILFVAFIAIAVVLAIFGSHFLFNESIGDILDAPISMMKKNGLSPEVSASIASGFAAAARHAYFSAQILTISILGLTLIPLFFFWFKIQNLQRQIELLKDRNNV